MKKLLLSVLLVVAGMIFSHNLFAQYPIPSFNVPVVVDPTIFEESIPLSSRSFNIVSSSLKQPTNIDEKKMIIVVKDDAIATASWVTLEVYSINGDSVFGPFQVNEGNTFMIALSITELWGVRVLNSSEECKMDIWFE